MSMYGPSVVYVAGLLLTFVGERLIGAGTGRWTTLVGVLLALLALGLRLARARRAQGEAKRVEQTLVGLCGLGALALLLYFGQSDLAAGVLGGPLDRSAPRLAVILAATWPALMLAALLPLLLVEMAYAAVARAPQLELLRIRDALLTGLGLAGALVFAFCFTYVATERDKKVDLSYFRTARAGEASRKIARALDQPVTVSLFFPPASEVREEVLTYLDDLKRESGQITVASYDYAIDPQKAKDLKVSGNGVVVISRGTKNEQLSLGLDLESARPQLRNLDKELQKRLIQVARPPRTVYLVTGHGERSSSPMNETDKRLTIRDLRELLQQQGYQLKELGAAEGLATDVPGDAGMVALLGPQKMLQPEEAAALTRYAEKGGRLFVALDPEVGAEVTAGYKDLLAKLGVSFSPALLANDQVFARRTYQQGDRANIVTGSYSSHPSVSTVGRLGMRAPLILSGAGSLEQAKDAKDVTVDFSVRAHPQTWSDTTPNFQLDQGEIRKGWQLAASVSGKKDATKKDQELRAFVIGDSDWLSDGVLGNPGNAYLLLDVAKWLLGDEAIAGEVTSELDVPIQHTKKQDAAWFYGTIFLAPGLWLGLGRLAMRRRRTTPRKEATR